jgi:hypothetical protein
MGRIPKRIVIYSKDIANITGRKKSWINNTMRKIRALHYKSNTELITIHEFCSYMKMKEEVVREFLVD